MCIRDSIYAELCSLIAQSQKFLEPDPNISSFYLIYFYRCVTAKLNLQYEPKATLFVINVKIDFEYSSLVVFSVSEYRNGVRLVSYGNVQVVSRLIIYMSLIGRVGCKVHVFLVKIIGLFIRISRLIVDYCCLML